MPIYAYRCSSCGHHKDVLQKFSDAPLTECPSCHEQGFARQVTAAAFQLKGSGWYVTDFRDGNKGAQKSPEAEKAGATDSDKAEGAKAEGGASASDSATTKASGAGASTAPSSSSAAAASATGGSSSGDGAAKPAASPAASPPAPKAG